MLLFIQEILPSRHDFSQDMITCTPGIGQSFSNSAITGVGRPRPGVRGRSGSRPGNWQGPLDGVGKAHRVHLWGYSDRNFYCAENISMIYLRKLNHSNVLDLLFTPREY